jgi:hypothetical protein
VSPCALAVLLALGGAQRVAAQAGPVSVVVGPPRGWAVSDRLGPRRLGRSEAELPSSPRELWRRELVGGLELPPVVDAAGGVIAAVASAPEVVRLEPDGRSSWRVRLDGAAAVVPPVIASDGAALVIGGDGRLSRLDAATGTVHQAVALGAGTREARATPLALEDGGVVVAADDALVRVSALGEVTARAPLADGAVGGLIGWDGGVLVTAESGDVLWWRAPLPPRRLGVLGGAPSGGGALVGERTLVAVVAGRRLVALDLRAGQTTLLLGPRGASEELRALEMLEGPPTLGISDAVLVATVAGELLSVDARGLVTTAGLLEQTSVRVDGDAGAPMASLFGKVDPSPSPPLVADRAGRVAFVRRSGPGRAGVIALGAAGAGVGVASQRFCVRPLAVLPAGTGRMLVACVGGSLGMFGP